MNNKFTPEQMKVITELSNKYGMPINDIKQLIISGLQRGISFKGAVIRFRMIAAERTGNMSILPLMM